MFDLQFHQILLNEFRERKLRNPTYSLRAFARDLGLKAPVLSDVLKGKKGLSHQSAVRVACCLRLTENEREMFVQLVLVKHARSAHDRRLAEQQLQSLSQHAQYLQMDIDKFQVISNWYHFAILELCEVNPKPKNAQEFARRLNLDLATVKEALQRLESLQLLATDQAGWSQTHRDLETPTDIPSACLRDHHLQMMTKAKESLIRDSVHERDFSNATFAMPADQLTFAKKEIKKFYRQLTARLNDSKEKKDRVYNLTIQLFPLDIGEGVQKKGES